MPLRSMTGFARTQGSHGAYRWHWELRSVNGRSLDVRLRLPNGCEAVEAPARDLCAKKLARGNVTGTLALSGTTSSTAIRLNEPALLQLNAAAKRAQDLCGLAPASLDGLLAIRGVLEVAEATETDEAIKARSEAMLANLGEALGALIADRTREGERLAAVLASQIDEIETQTAAAERSPSRFPERIQARLAEQVQRLLGATPQLEPQRLHQEAVLLAVKADIEEELQRLKSHITEARSLLTTTEPAGRKLDFLAQEFFREANTLCSKSNDVEITKAGLAMKLVIDQMREQVQNIE
jgi:uncharacterized protein (TIGR00255 family)